MKKRLFLLLYCLILVFTLNAQKTWTDVEAGGEFSVGIQSDSALYTWGLNTNGQLGNGETSELPVAEYEKISSYEDWYDVAAGANHVIALKDSGSLYGWGSNAYQNIYGLFTEIVDEPKQIGNRSSWDKIYAGLYTSFAIDTLGHLYGWGRNSHGQLSLPTTDQEVSTPSLIDSSRTWLKVVPGHEFTLFLDSNGRLYGSGRNNVYQLTNNFGLMIDRMVLLDSVNVFKDIGANFSSSHAISNDGILYSWGGNQYKELGLDSTVLYVDSISMNPFGFENEELECGSVYTLLTKSSGTIYGFGNNVLGAIGVSNPELIISELEITGVHYDKISASIGLSDGLEIYGGHTLWLPRHTHAEYCASGANYAGQLGNGETKENIRELTCEMGQLQVSNSETEFPSEFAYFPNPTSQTLNISLEDAEITALWMYNIRGEVVMNLDAPSPGVTEIDVSDYPEGMYFLRFLHRSGVSQTAKIIKIQ